MTEYHRDSKRFVRENCAICDKDLDECAGVVVYLGCDLEDSGIMPNAEPTKFYFRDRCPNIRVKEGRGDDRY